MSVQETMLTAIADAIREKDGTAEPIPASDFPDRIQAIAKGYQDVSAVTAGAADVLTGKVIVNAAGQTVAGTMPNNGALDLSLDGLTTTSAAIPAGYASGGTVSLTDDIEEALAAI